MRNGLVIADSGAIFSLAIIDKLEILNLLFDKIRIPVAVWEEITSNKTTRQFQNIQLFFKDKVQKITGFNELSFLMDYGESESVILYQELKADYLLIDDNRARIIAESLDVNCIGSIGLLIKAKQNGMITELKPIFEMWISLGRFFSKKLLNKILVEFGETPI